MWRLAYRGPRPLWPTGSRARQPRALKIKEASWDTLRSFKNSVIIMNPRSISLNAPIRTDTQNTYLHLLTQWFAREIGRIYTFSRVLLRPWKLKLIFLHGANKHFNNNNNNHAAKWNWTLKVNTQSTRIQALVNGTNQERYNRSHHPTMLKRYFHKRTRRRKNYALHVHMLCLCLPGYYYVPKCTLQSQVEIHVSSP